MFYNFEEMLKDLHIDLGDYLYITAADEMHIRPTTIGMDLVLRNHMVKDLIVNDVFLPL